MHVVPSTGSVCKPRHHIPTRGCIHNHPHAPTPRMWVQCPPLLQPPAERIHSRKPRSPRKTPQPTCGLRGFGTWAAAKTPQPTRGLRGNPRSLHFRGCAGRRSSVFGVLGVSLICIFVLMTWHSHSSCTHDCAFSASCTYNLAFSFYALS